MADDTQALPVPQELFDSMTQLRRDAGKAKSLVEWRRTGRYATREEIELSEALSRPNDCVGHSSRTGLRCRQRRILGLSVCARHGGNLTRVKRKAQERLAKAVAPVLTNMVHIATQRDNLQAAVKAGVDVLDRADIGELVQAKVKAADAPRAHGDYDPARGSFHIGFLGLFINPTPEQREEIRPLAVKEYINSEGLTVIEVRPPSNPTPQP